MCEFKVRSMRMSEFNTVAQLVYDSVHTLCTKEYTKEQLDAWVPKDLYMPAFRRSIFRCYAIVAVCNKEIIGFMSTERDGYINRLYTSPDWVKKGVATALLENTEEWAKVHKIKELVLEASKSAEGFYIKRGFVKTGEIRSIKNNLEFVSAKMRKELKNG
ncbi:MAG: GNAT family N-acetyltransferase [Clostridia bacterium]|nr:GNAT family N-acetyltransferase [Clostridia bacterium]